MSTTSDRSPVRLASDMEYPLRSGNGAPVFTGDLLPSDRAGCSQDPVALWAALPSSPVTRDCHDYYGSSAASRRRRRTVRLPRTPCGFAGTAGALPTFTHTPVGRVGAQLYPGDVAARHRNPARGLARPSEYRTGETAPSENEDRASRRPIAASFGAGDEYRGFHNWYRFPYALLPC